MITSWQSTPIATRLIAAEASLLAGGMGDVFGFELLQLGRWGPNRELLATTRIRHQAVVADTAGAGVDVVARLTHLPVQSSAIDAVLLPHVLEFESEPHAVLREVDRVLVGDGLLLLLGFRPAGPWGWRAAATRRGFPPGLRQLLSEQRVRDWLGLLNFEIVSVRHYLYTLPSDRQPAAAVDMGAHDLRRGWFYPWPAGAYFIKARKRLYSVTPLRARKRELRALLGGAMEPST